MNKVHIFRAETQDAMNYICDAGFKNTHKPKDILGTTCCKKNYYAETLHVHSYYDGDRYFCKKGTGCKR